MIRKNRRGQFIEDKQVNKTLIFSASVFALAILAFIVAFVGYRNYLSSQLDMSEYRSQIAELGKINQEIVSEQASSSIGKNVNEMTESTENVQKIAINTSNMTKENASSEDTNVETNTNETKQTNSNVTSQEDSSNVQKKSADENKVEEKIPDPTFKKPVEGEIINEFAKDTLIYSNTLQEWVTHNGIDIKADKTTIVKASADGTVKSIKNDPRFGITVVIEHVNGYYTIYANLLTAEFIKEGENVSQGQTIGTVGNTATFEIADAPHLHFEILRDGEYLDPEQYLK